MQRKQHRNVGMGSIKINKLDLLLVFPWCENTLIFTLIAIVIARKGNSSAEGLILQTYSKRQNLPESFLVQTGWNEKTIEEEGKKQDEGRNCPEVKGQIRPKPELPTLASCL